jgi:hypothetical protein
VFVDRSVRISRVDPTLTILPLFMKIDIPGRSLPSLGSTTVTLSIRNEPAFGVSCRAGVLLQAVINVARGANSATLPSNHPRREILIA